jgi:hypothetical protein
LFVVPFAPAGGMAARRSYRADAETLVNGLTVPMQRNGEYFFGLFLEM